MIYLEVGGTLVGSTCEGFETKQTARSRSPADVSTSTFGEEANPCAKKKQAIDVRGNEWQAENRACVGPQKDRDGYVERAI